MIEQGSSDVSSVASFFVLSLPVMSLYSESTNTHSKVHIRIVNILFLVAVIQNFKQSYF